MSAGRFVWHELMTNDAEKATDFYTRLLGWTTRDQDMGPTGTYRMIHDGHGETGGIVQMNQGEGGGLPTHWLPCVTVTDTDAACARVAELGGRVIVGPMDIPEVGRFAIILDDQGAGISILGMPQEMPEREGMPKAGQFCWYTLLTRDADKAQRFWTGLLGWTCQEIELGAGQRSHVFFRGSAQVAGLNVLEDGNPAPPHWSTVVAVENLTASLDKAVSLGATIMVPPAPVGSMGTFAVICDPVGAFISLFQGNA